MRLWGDGCLALGSPDTKTHTLLRSDPVADRNDHVKVVEIRGFLLKFGNSEFLGHITFL